MFWTEFKLDVDYRVLLIVIRYISAFNILKIHYFKLTLKL